MTNQIRPTQDAGSADHVISAVSGDTSRWEQAESTYKRALFIYFTSRLRTVHITGLAQFVGESVPEAQLTITAPSPYSVETGTLQDPLFQPAELGSFLITARGGASLLRRTWFGSRISFARRWAHASLSPLDDPHRSSGIETASLPPEAYTEESFTGAVTGALDEEPIEDGLRHPVERILATALRWQPDQAADWIQSLFIQLSAERPHVAAGIVRSLGRLPKGALEPWGMWLAAGALTHRNIQVRESAVRALEMWGGEDAMKALQIWRPNEPRRWLARYIEQVIRDLS